ncbi:hypothetical protein [Limnobacter sp.]|uniref:hypothetical protein n=1 Tax=Limnobacter sp. TaxID=2003368 RepID=UPI0025B8DFFA|nr:hypothetical protein [Limnobacter sp.]
MSTLNTCTSSTRPASPSQGDMLYETDTYKTIIYDGSQWREYQSTNSPYSLDGTNSVSQQPLWHLDAAKINGVDSSGNPSNGSSLTTAWKPKFGSSIYNHGPQSSSSAQPTWYSSGENSLPYLDWDGGDQLIEQTKNFIYGPFVWFQVMKSDNGYWTGMNGTSNGLFTRRASDLLYYYSDTNRGYNGTVNNSGLTSLSASTRMLLFEKPNTSDPSYLYVDGDNAQGSTGSGASTSNIGIGGFGGGFSSYRPNGKVYEMALWIGGGGSATSGPLTTADKNALIDYVESKYNLSGFTDF